MGILVVGTPLSWEDTKKNADYVREHGIEQLIHIYNQYKDRCCDTLKWGDEVEYMICRKNSEGNKIQLVLKGERIFEELDVEQDDELWRPEYASYMLEGTPGQPYGGTLMDLLKVERSMIRRRKQVEAKLRDDELLVSYSTFPRLGCEKFTIPEYVITDPVTDNPATQSEFFPDGAINSHPRFATLSRNIRQRRGKKVAINIPMLIDENTISPYIDGTLKTEESRRAQMEDHIYMDCTGFGMGNSCLQVTFQASSVCEAKHLYDQLIPMTPIMLAISAASPIFRGLLADVDTRWSAISASVDCRTDIERGSAPSTNDQFVIPKSRYASVSSYLSDENQKYNDMKLVINSVIEKKLLDAGMEPVLATHFAHLFIRDPLTLWGERIHLNDAEESDHFENIQSTNWQTLRFKPPPPNSPIGWRVEFRPMEVQFTEFENAAHSVFIVLLTRVLLSYHLNLTVPISKVEENMKRAEHRDAVLKQKFYFRKNPDEEIPVVLELTCNEVINGGRGFLGLIPYIKKYLDDTGTDIRTRCKLITYLDFVSLRASGKLMTTAKWMRKFVTNHPDYKKDSVVSDKVTYDLTVLADDIVQGRHFDPTLLPKIDNCYERN